MIVAVYDHPHGQVVMAFRTIEGAHEWRRRIADQWWDDEIPDDIERPADLDKLADAYWDWQNEQGDSHFTVHTSVKVLNL